MGFLGISAIPIEISLLNWLRLRESHLVKYFTESFVENEKGKLKKTGSGGERNREVIGRTEKESVSKRDT